MFLAVDHNQPMTVYTLLRLKANPKLYNRNGYMAIHQAAFQGDPETLVILLHNDGQSVHYRARDGSSPLHLAAKRGHVLCTQILLSCGADMTLVDNNGHTALQLAEEARMAGMSRLVLGGTLLRDWLSRFGLIFTLIFLLDVVMIMTRDQHRTQTPDLFRRCRVGGSLHIAAMRGDVALVRKLLREGAEVSFCCVFYTALSSEDMTTR